MYIRNTDRYSLAEAYNAVRDCECQHAADMNNIENSADERVDMILNNLVVLNNKTAELVTSIQAALESGEGIDQWVSEKIAVAASMIGAITDYYAKYNTPSTGLNLQPSTLAANFPPKTNMPPVTIAI
jgi:hypothetical protein